MATLQEANRIKDRLRACTTAAEVERVSDEERDTVMGWNEAKKGTTEHVMSLHIINLKKRMIAEIEGR